MAVKCNAPILALSEAALLLWGIRGNSSNADMMLENYAEFLNCTDKPYKPCKDFDCNNPTIVTSFPVTFWGWKDDNTVLSQVDIEASTNHARFPFGATIIADFTTNSSPKYLWIAVAKTEPIATDWYGAINNDGKVGDNVDDSNLFRSPVISGDYNFYITNWQTQQEETTIQLRH